MDVGFTAADAFNALLYPPMHVGTAAYLQSQYNGISNVLNNAGRAFIDRSKEIFNHYNSSAAIQFARNIVQTIKGTDAQYNSQYVVKLWDLAAMQKANLVMQRWMMANPNVRNLYHKQQLDGYSSTYVDVHGTVSGEAHYDYRRVQNGMVQFNEEDNTWKAVEYFEELDAADRELTFEEQLDIIASWGRQDHFLAVTKDDPTNPNGGKL